MVLNGFIDKDIFYDLIDEKLKSLGITEKDYPLNSKEIIDMYSDKIELEYIKFNSINIGGILYKDPVKSFIALNSSRSKKGQNFDGMHELIHYWFHPYSEYLCNDRKRRYVQNKDIEWQANEGAAQALMPKDLFIQKYIEFKGEVSALSDFFFVGEQAVVYRMINLGLDDKYVFLLDVNRSVLKQYSTRICTVCKNPDIDVNSQYCPICGSFLDTLIIKGADYVIYSGLDLDEDMKLKTCPCCLNTEIDEKDVYCKVCGQYLYNDCTNQNCDVYRLPGKARYCPQCGSESSFKSAGLLKDWEDSLEYELSKAEFEEGFCTKTGKIVNIDDWGFFSFSLSMKGKVYLSKLLEHTTAKKCGDVLIIYAPNYIIKNKLDTERNLELIMEYLEPELNIKCSRLEIACLNDFYPEKIIFDEPPF